MKLRLPCRVRSAFAGGRYRAAHSADDTIKKLGINLDELKKKTPAEQFRTLGSAINTIQDPSQKAAASMERIAR